MSKRKPSKFRKRKREQRERARPKPITIDIETCPAAIIGRDVHKQIMVYAAAAGLDEVVVLTGGDVLHEIEMPRDVRTFDLVNTRKLMVDYDDLIRRAMASAHEEKK